MKAGPRTEAERARDLRYIAGMGAIKISRKLDRLLAR